MSVPLMFILIYLQTRKFQQLEEMLICHIQYLVSLVLFLSNNGNAGIKYIDKKFSDRNTINTSQNDFT